MKVETNKKQVALPNGKRGHKRTNSGNFKLAWVLGRNQFIGSATIDQGKSTVNGKDMNSADGKAVSETVRHTTSVGGRCTRMEGAKQNNTKTPT